MKNTKIAWCDHTFNPWVGCEAKSEGCVNCYAKAMHERWKGKGSFKVRSATSAKNWEQPHRWNLEAKKSGKRARVFCGSMCDWLDRAADLEYRAMLLTLICETPELDWLVLTKRPENFQPMLTAMMRIALPRHTARMVTEWMNGRPPENVWFGVTAENQQRWNERVSVLRGIPATVRWVSCEPMLGAIEIGRSTRDARQPGTGVDWIVAGGENGPGARECHMSWLDGLCMQAGGKLLPFFFKQWGKKSVMDMDEEESAYLEGEREWPGERENRTDGTDRTNGGMKGRKG